MALDFNIDELRSVQWGNTADWNLRFIGDKAKKFYASNYTLTHKYVNTHELEFATATIPIPKSLALAQLSDVTIVDNVENDFLNWINEWIDDIVDIGVGCLPLKKATRSVVIERLNSKHVIVGKAVTYLVIPTTGPTELGTSEAGLKVYNLQFAIVGEL